MGLLYAFPVSTEETDFVQIKDKKITLKSYGLPYLFWGYAAAILIVIGFMFFAIKAPILKLISLGDETDALLGYSLLSFIAFLPLALLSFFFFEKRIIRHENRLGLEYRVAGLKFFSEEFEMDPVAPLSVRPFLDSPNVARMKGTEESAGFQNKGYFILWLKTAQGKTIQVDRSSRKADLDKISALILNNQ